RRRLVPYTTLFRSRGGVAAAADPDREAVPGAVRARLGADVPEHTGGGDPARVCSDVPAHAAVPEGAYPGAAGLGGRHPAGGPAAGAGGAAGDRRGVAVADGARGR